LIAAVETTAGRKPSRIKLLPGNGVRNNAVETLARASFAAGSTIVSDRLACWPAVAAAGCDHCPIRTGPGKQAARRAPFTWVNTTRGNSKTALAGTSHHVSAKHARASLASFAWRFNRRHQLETMTEPLMWAGPMAKPTPYHVIIVE
jgi:hypothetical protein